MLWLKPYCMACTSARHRPHPPQGHPAVQARPRRCRVRRCEHAGHPFPSPVSLPLLLMEILGFLIIGLLAGWLAGEFTKGHGFGLVGDIVVGIIGALIGGFI